MRVEVYKCRFTGQLFEKKDALQYILHLEDLRERRKKRLADKRLLDGWDNWLLAERSSITHINDLAPWFLKNQQKIMNWVNATGDIFGKKNIFHPDDEFIDLHLTLKWNPMCSCTHAAPDGKPTNFTSQDHLPKGYPGWTGRLSGSFFREKNISGYPYGEAYRAIGIKTGSGGGGNINHNYDITIFLDDFPGLRKQFEIEQAIRDSVDQISHMEGLRRQYNHEQTLIINRLKGSGTWR